MDSVLRGPHEVAESEATGELAVTYRHLKTVLGVPFVPTIYRILGTYERYLRAGVDAAGDLLAGDTAETFGEAVRETAAGHAAQLPGRSLPLSDPGAVHALIERYNLANPRSLLFATALRKDPAPRRMVMASPAVDPPADDTLGEINRYHGDYVIPGFWRELGEWPEAFTTAWSAVRPLAGTERLLSAQEEMEGLALRVSASTVAPGPAELGYSDEQCAQIAGILDWFKQNITAMIIEIEYVRRLAGDAHRRPVF